MRNIIKVLILAFAISLIGGLNISNVEGLPFPGDVGFAEGQSLVHLGRGLAESPAGGATVGQGQLSEGPCRWLQGSGIPLSGGAESALSALCAQSERLGLPPGMLGILLEPESERAANATGPTPEIQAQARVSTTDMQINAPDLTPPDPDQTTQNEVAIAVSGNNIVVGWNDLSGFVSLPSTSNSGYAYSNDGGATFTDGGAILPGSIGPPDFPFNGFAIALGDPDITADSQGNFYYSNLTIACQFSDPNNPNSCFFSDSFIGVWKSVDGGVTFTGPTLVPGSGSDLFGSFFQDKELIAVDTTNNNIYLSWTEFSVAGSQIVFRRSTDGGVNWDSSHAT